jgi:hypothetical protein
LAGLSSRMRFRVASSGTQSSKRSRSIALSGMAPGPASGWGQLPAHTMRSGACRTRARASTLMSSYAGRRSVRACRHPTASPSSKGDPAYEAFLSFRACPLTFRVTSPTPYRTFADCLRPPHNPAAMDALSSLNRLCAPNDGHTAGGIKTALGFGLPGMVFASGGAPTCV